MARRVARIWKRGGAFLKDWEKCKRPWPEFSLFLNQFHTVCPNIETKFLGKLGNSNVFSAQKQVVSKKKKKVFTEIDAWRSSDVNIEIWRISNFAISSSEFKGLHRISAKIGNSNVFSAQKQVVSKKKKRGLHRNWVWFFGQNRKFKRFLAWKQEVSKRKKKRSSPKLSLIFRPKSKIQALFHTASQHLLHDFGTQFPLGGLFSIFHQKSA